MHADDERWMRQALDLAERGRGHVEPNPLVGAVVVRDGVQVGAGWHERFGGPHAEVNALAAAGGQARDATIYVTLEPCCHHGKTPPCTDAVLQAGVKRVVAAMADPFPAVSGQGIAQLRAAGLQVDVGLCETEARRMNAPFLKLVGTGRPYVHAKWAMTLDGKIATRTGDSKWISNEASRGYVHALRGRMDAIVVGSGTVLADDPLLTARPPGPRAPLRVVLDRRGRLRPDSQLARTAGEAPVLLAMGEHASPDGLPAGIECLKLPEPNIPGLLDELGRRRFTNILVEGGSSLLGSFLDAGAIDEVHVFIAPKLAGGSEALSPLGGLGVDRIADALQLEDLRVEPIAGDILIRGQVSEPIRLGLKGRFCQPRP